MQLIRPRRTGRLTLGRDGRDGRDDRDDRGLTLVELVVTTGLLLLIMTAILPVLETGQRTQKFTTDRQQQLDEMRLAMNEVAKDLRQTADITAIDAGLPLPAGTTTTSQDLTVDTYVAGNPVSVRFYVSAGTLYKESGGSTRTLLTNVANTDIFQVQTRTDGPPIAIVIVLVMQKPNDRALRLESDVRLRNVPLPTVVPTSTATP